MSFVIQFSMSSIIVQEKIGSGSYGTVYKALLVGYGEITLKELTGNVKKILTELVVDVRIGELKLAHSKCAKRIFIDPTQMSVAKAVFGEHDVSNYVRVATNLTIEKQASVFVMYDLVNGITLDKYVNEMLATSVFPPMNVIHQNALDMMYAVQELHASGIAHCDVKPENMMLEKGNVILIDFGMACFANKCKGLKGSPLYTSPEMYLAGVNKEWENVNWLKFDVFAVGMSIFFLFFGETVYNLMFENLENVYQLLMFSRLSMSVQRERIEAVLTSDDVEEKYRPFFRGMLNVNVGRRFTIEEGIRVFRAIEGK